MKPYTITITETLQMEVDVEASSRPEAAALVEQQWKNGDHVLDADNFKGVTFKVNQPQHDRGFNR